MAVSKRLRYEILRRDNHTCRYCGNAAPDVRLTVDHVVPVALGGSDESSNLVAACVDCNAGKSSASPDTSLVDDVSQDALRWARAMERAAADMLADHDTRAARRQEFEDAWNTWLDKAGNTVPLPDDWETTVDSFLAAGLPMSILLECIDIAMKSKKVRLERVFRYFCGVAWRRVSELHERAQAELGQPAEATAPASMLDAGSVAFEQAALILSDVLASVLGGDKQAHRLVSDCLYESGRAAHVAFEEFASNGGDTTIDGDGDVHDHVQEAALAAARPYIEKMGDLLRERENKAVQ